MKTTKCKHPNAVEDGYFECYFCEDCGNYIQGEDVHFDTYGKFHEEETCPTVLSVGEEEIHDELFFGLYMSSTDFLGHTDSCYMNLTEDQVIELHNLLTKHIHNVNMKNIKKFKKEYTEEFVKDVE
ncbi:hypothetical protein SALINJAH_131 [Bacillus phage SalinJah]|uniref:Uncharacterized protein n=1 Tax=Bacillus phage SalinJah TaxID=1837830 RepID=A0A173GBS7_9CAUD|nr:hypothetical protein SALINJAH_131 [Bacillus phage SalinJah]ANH50598.1 hypothetical protein SALINJAH_131 [Bacillus phage SalinJah]